MSVIKALSPAQAVALSLTWSAAQGGVIMRSPAAGEYHARHEERAKVLVKWLGLRVWNDDEAFKVELLGGVK